VKLADAIATAPRRTLLAPRPTRHPVTSCADPARGPGRYHRTGEPGVWYASNKEKGAWAELFGHFVDEGVDPFEVRRRVGRVTVVLQVLDLTDERTRSHLGVDETDLLSDDYTTTQAIAAAARDANFDAVRQPPPRLAELLPLIRPHEHVPDSVRRLLETLTRAGPKRSGAGDVRGLEPGRNFCR
jgi:RES domain-containing protein